MVWKRRTTPVKAKTHLSAGKVLTTVIWDAKGVVLVDFLLEQRAMHAVVYYSQRAMDAVVYYSEPLAKVRGLLVQKPQDSYPQHLVSSR